MAMGEEVGDAYISIHANTKAARAEIAALGKDSHKDFLGMDDDINKVNDSLDKTTKKTTGRDRFDQLKEKLREVGNESKKLGNTMKGTFKDKDVLVGKLRQGFNRLKTEGIQPLLKDWREMGEVKEKGIRVDKKVMSSHERLAQSTRNLRKETKRTTKEFSLMHRVMTKITSPIRKLRSSFTSSFRRMDSTVRLVIGLIAVAGNLVAGLGSGMGAAFLAVAGAAALAAVALSSLIGVVIPLAYGFILLKKSFTDEHGNFTLEKVAKFAPEAATALGNLRDVINKIDAGALFEHWNDSLTTFANTLADSLEFDELAAGIGDAFSAITDSLTGVLTGDSWEPFMAALEGPLVDALTNFGKALEPLIETFLDFVTAAAPFAVILSEQFLKWAEGLHAAFTESVNSGKFQEVMELAISSLDSILDLAGSVGDALSNLFTAGAPSGIILLNLLTGVIDKFVAWSDTLEGQNALKTWFDQGVEIMTALGRLVGDIGKGLGSLVTPEVVDDLVGFLGAVGDIVPVLAELLSIIGQAHILTVLATALSAIGDLITPLVQPVTDFFKAFSAGALKTIEDIGPSLTAIGDSLGALFAALTPLMPVLTQLVTDVFEALAPILTTVIDLFVGLVTAITPALAALSENKDLVTFLVTALVALVGIMKVVQVVSKTTAAVNAFLAGSWGTATVATETNTAATNLNRVAQIKSGIETVRIAAMMAAAWVKSTAQSIASFARMRAMWLAENAKMLASNIATATKTAAIWVSQNAKMLASQVATAAKTAAVWVATNAKTAASAVASAAKTTAAWVASNAKVIASNVLAAASFLAQKAAIVAGTIATGLATAAQWLFNAAMTANPIGIIIVAVTALVAALVWFFTQTEIGQQIWTAFTDALVVAWNFVVNAIQVGIDAVVGFFQGLWDFLLLLFSWSPLGIIIENWDAIAGFFSTWWENLVAGFQVIWDFIENLWNVLNPLPAIQAIWNAIVTFFRAYVTAVQTVFTGVRDFIAGIWENLNPLPAIRTIWDNIIDFFEGFVDDVGEVFGNIADAIENAFRGAFNFIADAWNNTVGSLEWTVPNWVPVIGGNRVAVPNIPKFAAGTIAFTPTIGEFGEAGPEALVPLNRPLNQVDPSVRALSAFAQGKMGPSIAEGAIVINTRSDNGRVVAESVLDRIVAYSR